MYNDSLSSNIINNLEQKIINIVKTNISLTEQGYVVNKVKKCRLDWNGILLNAFENINIFSEEQQLAIERLYNNVNKI